MEYLSKIIINQLGCWANHSELSICVSKPTPSTSRTNLTSSNFFHLTYGLIEFGRTLLSFPFVTDLGGNILPMFKNYFLYWNIFIKLTGLLQNTTTFGSHSRLLISLRDYLDKIVLLPFIWIYFVFSKLFWSVHLLLLLNLYWGRNHRAGFQNMKFWQENHKIFSEYFWNS